MTAEQQQGLPTLAPPIVAPASSPASPGCAGAPGGPRLRLGFRARRPARLGGCQSRHRSSRQIQGLSRLKAMRAERRHRGQAR